MKGRSPSAEELQEIAEGAAALPDRGWRHQPTEGLDLFALRTEGDEIVHLYARRERGQALLKGLDLARTELPRLVAEVERLRQEVEDARARPVPREAASAPEPRRAPASVVPIFDDDEGTGLGLAAPFRVGPKEMKAAQTDPLVALSVQVARALQGDAKELERARLIAMAYAAARADLDAFWSARKMRTVKADGKEKGPAKKK
jgi:hypothetical protein